jgi:L-fuculose-phosphate aldolase
MNEQTLIKQTCDDELQLRQQLIDYAIKLNSSGLTQGKSGNISVRFNEGFLITPTALDYHQLTSEDIVHLQQDGSPSTQHQRKPSSEWPFHCDLYRNRSDINAIVHAHPDYCTALACTRRAIPAFHYMVAIAGGDDIPLAPYALFGTEQLSHNVVTALAQRQACLIENHGMIAIGTSLDHSFNLALEVETLAKQYCETIKLGNVSLLSKQQMNEVIERFKTYGQRT